MFLRIKKTKFNVDLFWNLIALGGILIIGLLLNILIVVFYDEETLGIFNQTYAIYIFLSQLAVGGVHLALQYYIPKNSFSQKNTSMLLTTALLASSSTSIIVILLSYLSVPLIGLALGSKNVEIALFYTLWGLFFFSLNKLILSFYNGLRKMKTFAFFQFLRFFLILGFLFFFIWQSYPPNTLPLILALAEFILLFIQIIFVFSNIKFSFSSRFRKTLFLQLRYGRKALLGNILLDLNTRVDVITLGVFLSDKLVGLYSFAAAFFEGFAQIAVIFRNNLNPLLTRSFLNRMLLQRVIRMNRNAFYRIVALLGLPAICVFPFIAKIFEISDIMTASIVFGVLCIGFLITAGYHPLLMFFNQIGKPNQQTLFITLIFISNVLFNIIFIPIFGLIGAAIATSCSYLVLMLYLKVILKEKYQIIV